MNRLAETWSRAFHESLQLLLQLHHEMSYGDADGQVADAIRDSMEQPWHELTDNEKEIVRGLSGDLYSISVLESAERDVATHIPQAILEATANARWDTLLELLRTYENSVPSHAVSYLRGVAWFHLGQPLVAKEFLHHAVESASNVLPAYLHYYFYTLIVLGCATDALPYAEQIASKNEDPLLLLDAAEVFFVRSTEVEGNEIDKFLEIARRVAKRGLESAKQAEPDEVLSIQCGLTHLWLALDYARSDDLKSANQSVALAQQFMPNDPCVILVESWLGQRTQTASWDQGVGIGLIRLQGARSAMARVPYAPELVR